MSEDSTNTGVMFLSSHNKEKVFGRYTKDYVLPEISEALPAVCVRVRSATIARVNSFVGACKDEDDQKTVRELCKLIADSVIEQDGTTRVWSDSEVIRMSKGSTMRFMQLQKAVLQHNGIDEKGHKVEEYLEEEKND